VFQSLACTTQANDGARVDSISIIISVIFIIISIIISIISSIISVLSRARTYYPPWYSMTYQSHHTVLSRSRARNQYRFALVGSISIYLCQLIGSRRSCVSLNITQQSSFTHARFEEGRQCIFLVRPYVGRSRQDSGSKLLGSSLSIYRALASCLQQLAHLGCTHEGAKSPLELRDETRASVSTRCIHNDL